MTTTPSAPPQSPAQSPVTTTQSPVTTIEALYDAFGRGDMDGLLGLISPDVDWSTQVDAPDADLVAMLQNGRGHDAVLHYFGGVAALEFHRFEPRRFLADGDTVYVELALDIEHRATGKRATLGEIHRFVVHDGLVVEYRSFVDTATLIELYRP